MTIYYFSMVTMNQIDSKLFCFNKGSHHNAAWETIDHRPYRVTDIE